MKNWLNGAKALAAVLAFYALWEGMRTYCPLDFAPSCFAACVAVSVVVDAAFRALSRNFYPELLKEWLGRILVAILAIIIGANLVLLTNAFLDSSPQELTLVHDLRFRVRYNEINDYWLEYRDPASHKLRKIDYNGDWRRYRLKEGVEVRRRGFFGWAWVQGVYPVTRDWQEPDGTWRSEIERGDGSTQTIEWPAGQSP